MAYRSASFLAYGTGAAPAVPVPTGAAVGDIVDLVLMVESTSITVTPPSGMTLVGSPLTVPAVSTASAPTYVLHHFRKTLTAADTGTYAFTLSASTNYMATAVAISGRTALDQTGQTATTSAGGTQPPAVAFTTTAVTDLVFHNYSWADNAAGAIPNFTYRASVLDGEAVATRDAVAAGAQSVQPAAVTSTDARGAVLTAYSSGSAPVTGTAALTGSGTLTASGVARPAGTVALSGSGSLGVTGKPSPAATLALTGSGTLTASGTASGSGGGTAALSGSGTLSAAGSPRPAATVALTGSGTLGVAGKPGGAGGASLGGSGSLTVAQGVTPKFLTGVHSSGRYFVDQLGAPWLSVQNSLWAMPAGVPATDTTTYDAGWCLRTIKNQGFNSLIVECLNPTDWGYSDTTFETYDGVTPFTDGTTYQAYREAFWTRVDAILTMAQGYGLTVYLYGLDTFKFVTVASQAACAALGTFLGNRYKTRPNLVWMAGGDYDTQSTSSDAKQAAFFDAIAATGDTHLTAIQLTGFPQSNSFDYSAWDSAYSRFSFVYSYNPTYDAVLKGYAHTWPQAPTKRPALFMEGNYERENNKAFSAGATDPNTIRRSICWAMTSGSPGYSYGQAEVWKLKNANSATWGPLLNGGDPGIAQVTALTTFWRSIAWHTLIPDTSSALVTAGRGTYVDGGTGSPSQNVNTDPRVNQWVGAAKSADGSLAVAYLPNAASAITVAAGQLGASPTARWVDPANGASVAATAPSGSTSYSRSTANSAGGTDWLLVMEAAPLAVSGTVTLSGSGSLSASGRPGSAGTPALTGSGSLTVTGAPSPASTVTLTGSGQLSATGTPSSAGPVQLGGSGQLSVGAGAAYAGTVALTGSGSLTAGGKPGSAGTVALAGSGQLAASGVGQQGTAVQLTGTGTLSTSGAASAPASVQLSGVGQLGVTGRPASSGGVQLSGSGQLAVYGFRVDPDVRPRRLRASVLGPTRVATVAG